MTRYIEANVLLRDLTLQKAAFETVHGGRSGLFAKGFACGLDGAIQSVKNAEAEDVSPVKHWKWLPLFNGEYLESSGGDMDTLDAERIVVETDCENPKTICVITSDEFIVSDGYRVRIKPKQPCD